MTFTKYHQRRRYADWRGPLSRCDCCGEATATLTSNSAIYGTRLSDMLCAGGYWCVVCGRYLPADEDGVIVHDDVPHPEDMTFDEEERPQ